MLQLRNDRIQYQTIDEAPPIGICGSGIVDAMAQLYMAGIIDESGRMKDGHPRVRTHKNQREFVLLSEEERNGYPPIVVTQSDLRELQLVKAAIRSGIEMLLETNARSEAEITQMIIAGAFGTYIDISSAVTIGMLPPLPLDRFKQIGNDQQTVLIGECINPTSKKRLAEALKAGNLEVVCKEAIVQKQAGADII